MKYLPRIFLLLSLIGKAQNINFVPNYSFEDTIICNLGYLYPNIKNWYNPTNNTPDAYHICGDMVVNVTDEVKIHSGNSRVAISLYSPLGPPYEQREYIATKLVRELSAGKRYCIDYYTMPSKISKYGCNSMGVYFGIGNQYYNTYVIPPVLPQSNIVLSASIIDTSDWYHYVDIYNSSGGETDIIIGNFVPDAQLITPVINTGPMAGADGAYFVIDDVSIHEMSLEIGNDIIICTGTEVTIGELNLDTAFNSYYWYHNGTLFDSLVSQKTMSFLQSDSFVVEKRFPCGSVFDTISISVKTNCIVPETEFIVPNVFSPNGDGINDLWEVSTTSTQRIEDFVIYDRWGVIIKDSKNIIFLNSKKTASWDGYTNSGIKCSNGIYYYIFEIKNSKGEIEKHRGYLTLIN